MLRLQVNSSQLGNISLPRNAKWAHWHQETALYEWFTSDGNVPISEIQRVCEFPEEFFEPDNTLLEHIPTSGLVLQNGFEQSQIWVYNSLYFIVCLTTLVPCIFLQKDGLHKEWMTKCVLREFLQFTDRFYYITVAVSSSIIQKVPFIAKVQIIQDNYTVHTD